MCAVLTLAVHTSKHVLNRQDYTAVRIRIQMYEVVCELTETVILDAVTQSFETVCVWFIIVVVITFFKI